MVIGTFFKTGFEKGLPLHEQVVKQLLPLMSKPRKAYWPYYSAIRESVVLPRRAGAALNTRLRMPGKNRRLCIPTNARPAVEIAQLLKEFKTNEISPQIFVSTSSPSDATPLHSESANAKWLQCLDEVNKTATAFNEAFEIHNESLSKEVLHRLVVPCSVKDGNLFVHDGALGSNSADDIKFTVVTHDPAAALFVRHMANPVPQVDPEDFPNLFTVFHIHDYQMPDPRIVEEFSGVSKEQLGLTSPGFVLYDLSERTAFVSGSTKALKDATLCLGSLVGYHLYGNLTMACNSFLDASGKLTIVFGSEGTTSSPKLFGAHHNIWTQNGISRVWNGVTTANATAKPQYASDLLETTDKGTYLTTPLSLQMGGKVRPRGSNLLAGAPAGTPERLQIDPRLSWRPNVVSAQGAKFIFVGKQEKPLTVEEAAQAFADAHAVYPTGFTTKKNMAARFKDLAATASGASFSMVTSTASLGL